MGAGNQDWLAQFLFITSVARKKAKLDYDDLDSTRMFTIAMESIPD
jgi:hypothetical protein